MSSRQNPEHKAAHEAGSLHETIDFVASIFDLLNDNITGPEWLAQFGKMLGCESVMCAWWPAEQPDSFLAEGAGPAIGMRDDWAHRLEAVFQTLPDADFGLLDEMSPSTACPLFTPEHIIACLDSGPARVVTIFAGRIESPVWTESDRARIRGLLPILRKSVTTKKTLSAYADRADLARKVFDSIPRGILALSPDRELVARNRASDQLIKSGELVRLRNGRFEFTDKMIQAEFEQQLAVVEDFPEQQIGEYVWYKRIGGGVAGRRVLLTMRALVFDNWRRESSPHERAVVITFSGAHANFMPGEKQLREFYGLTASQARVANELLRLGSLEESADKLGISIHTARSHLRSIFEKIGVENQAQLFREISQNALRLGVGNRD